MRPSLKLAAAAIALLAAPMSAEAQGLAACDNITGDVNAGNYADALYNLDICEGAVRSAWLDGLLAAVNVPLVGLQPRDGKIDSAMGVSVLTIHHGDFESTYTVGSGGAENPIAALGGLAGLAGSLGFSQRSSDGPTVDQVEIARRLSGTRERDENGSCTITTGTDDGMMVQKGPDCDQIVELARAFFGLVDDYLENN